MAEANTPTTAAVIAITMAYNEGDTLRRWLQHYRAQVGNVLVIDHGSDDGSTDDITDRLRLPRSPFDDGERAEMISELQRTLLRSFDAVIYTDTDELLVADPARFATLRDYVAGMTEPVARAVGFDVLHIRDREPSLDPARSIFEQRRYVWMRSGPCKPLIVREATEWAAGFHACDRRAPADPALWLFHTKYADFDSAMRRQAVTRGLLWSDRALAGHWGDHQRQSDEWTGRQQFADPENILRQQGAALPFDPSPLADQFNAALEQVGAMWCSAPFNGPILQMPSVNPDRGEIADLAVVQDFGMQSQSIFCRAGTRQRAQDCATDMSRRLPQHTWTVHPAASVIDESQFHQRGDMPMRHHNT